MQDVYKYVNFLTKLKSFTKNGKTEVSPSKSLQNVK